VARHLGTETHIGVLSEKRTGGAGHREQQPDQGQRGFASENTGRLVPA
jgi:hypothetical protein